MTRKKFLIGAVLAIVLAALAGLAYFFVVPQRAKIIENNPAASQTAPRLKSFKGVLADIPKKLKPKPGKLKKKSAKLFPTRSPRQQRKILRRTRIQISPFAILGDTQYFTAGQPAGKFSKSNGTNLKNNPDLVIAVGDLVSNCEEKANDAQDYANWKNIVGSLSPQKPMLCRETTIGRKMWTNATNSGRTASFFRPMARQASAEFAYSLDVKNSHFVFLDSDKPKEHLVNGEQRAWLEKDLAANKKENTFVFFHEPAYPVSDKTTESLDADPSERNALWQILEKYNVTAVFNGHEHIVSRRKIGNVYQFVFGSTDSFNHGLPAAGVAEYANQGQGRFGLVKVNGKEITVETHGPDGAC